MKQKELLECELIKEREKLEMVRFDIITLTAPMMTRGELQQLCDEILLLRSACERLADEIDVVTARKALGKLLFFSILISFSYPLCSSTFANDPIETKSSSSTHPRCPPLPLTSSIALLHTAVTNGRITNSLSPRSSAQLQRGDAWVTNAQLQWVTNARHQQFAESRRRQRWCQWRRLGLLALHIPQLSSSKLMRAVWHATCPGYKNHF